MPDTAAVITFDTIRAKITDKKYEPTAQYPSAAPLEPSEREILAHMKSPAGSSLTWGAARSTLHTAYRRKREAYETARQLYQDQSRACTEQFMADLLAASGYADNPITAVLRHCAWQSGHSGGYWDVLTVFQDLLENFKAILDGYNLVPKNEHR